ncbi:MAG: helix-turn-helix transcriptional regulator [Leptolyngbya sp. SIOISBB]|nr:helix-turn-helix transcriptional regulator [Leptolyngbya sp. SIOISBB]
MVQKRNGSSSGYSYLTKPALREVFNATIRDLDIVVKKLAQKAGVPASSISRFQTGNRELTTAFFQKILNAFTIEEYRYFLSLQAQVFETLKGEEPALVNEDLSDDPSFHYSVFRMMVANFAQSCDSEQFEDLLGVLIDGRRRKRDHPELHEDVPVTLKNK